MYFQSSYEQWTCEIRLRNFWSQISKSDEFSCNWSSIHKNFIFMFLAEKMRLHMYKHKFWPISWACVCVCVPCVLASHTSYWALKDICLDILVNYYFWTTKFIYVCLTTAVWDHCLEAASLCTHLFTVIWQSLQVYFYPEYLWYVQFITISNEFQRYLEYVLVRIF